MYDDDDEEDDLRFFHEEMDRLLDEFKGFFPNRTVQFNQDDLNECMVEISDAEDGLMTPHQDKDSGMAFYVTYNDGMYELKIQTIVMNGDRKGTGLARDMVETLLEFFGEDGLLSITLTDQSHGWWTHFAETHPEYPWNIEDDNL
jgi:predicted GNAT family acetyltransferase